MTPLQIGLVTAAVLATTFAVLAWTRPPLLGELQFFYRLFLAPRQASQFYAACLWVTKDLAYHPEMPRRLDVYRPETGSGHPVIVYVYGGSWSSGNKELYAPAAQR